MLWALCKSWDRWRHKQRIKRECMELTRVGIQLGLIEDVRLLICREYIWEPFDEQKTPFKYYIVRLVFVCVVSFAYGKFLAFVFWSVPRWIECVNDVFRSRQQIADFFINVLSFPVDFLIGDAK